MLLARDLRVTRGGHFLLDVPSLDLPAGQVTAVLGSNGAGKSTLFGVLAFLERPDTGTLTLAGRTVTTSAERRDARRRVTLVEQHPLLFRGTVRDNLEWPLRARGTLEPVNGPAARFGIAELLEREARTLSGGEIQQVAMARAVLCRPDVLLLDEPTSAGDRSARDAVGAVLAEARENGVAVALASHQLGDAYRWSDRVVGLAAGRVDTVTPENLFRTTLPAGSGQKPAVCGSLTIHVVSDLSGPVTIAVPPEDIVVSAAPFQSSARNAFPGRVTAIAEIGGGRVSVTADVGTTLTARVTPGALRELGISVGSAVVLTIKATAVRVL